MSRRLAVPEAAEYLGVKERKVRELIAQRKITIIKIDHLVRFDTNDLDAYLRDNRIEAQP